MKAKCITKHALEESTMNQTKCTICKESVFKVTRITSDLIMLKCINCEETHMISTKESDKTSNLTFWS